MNSRAITLALWAACLVLVQPVIGLVVLSPSSLNETFFPSPEFIYIPDPVAVTGELVSWELVPEQDRETAFRGKILFTSPLVTDGPATQAISFEECWRRLRAYDPIAIIYGNPNAANPGLSECNTDDMDHSEFRGYLITELGYYDALELQQYIVNATALNETVVVHLGVGDQNLWREARQHPGFYVWQVFYALLGTICASFAFAKLVSFVRAYGFQLSIAQVCLCIQWICNTLRIVYWALDPGYLNRRVMNYTAQQVLTSITWPGEVICTLLVALYWHEAITKTDVQVNTFLSRLRTPFIVISVIVFVVELVCICLRAIHVATFIAVIVTAVVYLISVVSVTIYFFIVAYRTLQQLKKSSGRHSSRKRSLRRVTNLVLAAGAFNMVWVLCFIVALASFYSIAGFYITWSFCYLGIFGGSFFQIMTFKTPRRSITSSKVYTNSASGGTSWNSAQSNADRVTKATS